MSTHSPDFLNAVELDEAFWLIKKDGYTEIMRAKGIVRLTNPAGEKRSFQKVDGSVEN